MMVIGINGVALWLSLVMSVVSYGFTGKFGQIPSELKELYQDKQIHVLNGDNYQSRFDIELFKYDFDQEKYGLKTIALVNQDYTFEFQNLSMGVYTLIINSYDFQLNNNRYTIKIKENDSGEVEVLSMENPYGSTKFNESSIISISNQYPLIIDIVQPYQFYELESNSLVDMLMNSPFGYIFKNKFFTIIFFISIGIMILPYVANLVAPGFVDSYNEIKEEINQEKQQKLKIVNQDEIDKQLHQKSTVSNPNSNIRKRKS